MHSKYSVRLLGGVSFEGPSGLVSGPPAQRRELALLAILAVASRRGVTRDKLVGYLWSDTDEDTARRLLSNALYVLRREMGEDSFQTAGDTVRLNAEIVWSDVGAFQEALAAGEMEEAAASYAGPLLEGFYADAGPAFEHWVDSERRRLALLYGEALESLADRAEAANDHAIAAGWWQRLVAHDPYNSRAVRRLMQALVAAGDRANALQAAAEHERLLKDELGLQASPEVLDLARKLREEETAPAERKPRPKATGLAVEVQPRRRLLTRRSAALGIVAALAVGGVVAVGFQLFGSRGLSFRAAAADFVDPRDCIVVAAFANETEMGGLGLAVREAVVTDIGQSGYVTVLWDSRVHETLGLMRLPDTTHVDQRLALEIARRENCPAVVSGTVAPLGTGYILGARVVEVSTGEEVKLLSEAAVNDSAVVPATETLARLVRRHLGESLPSISRSDPLPRITTSSLEALRLYSLGSRSTLQGAPAAEGIALLEQAVALDTAFAEAYRRLTAFYGNVGNTAAQARVRERAYRFRERLPPRERLRIIADTHADLDSAVHYFRMGLELYPEPDIWSNNLGWALNAMGRYEEALQVQHSLAFEQGVGVRNLVHTAQVLGRHALADSGLAILREQLPPGHLWILEAEAGKAYSAGDLLLVDSLAREMPNVPTVGGYYGRLDWLAGLASMRGRVNEALALADSAAALAFEANSIYRAFLCVRFIELTSLAASTPERAIPYLERRRSELSLGTGLGAGYYWGVAVMGQGYALAGDLELARDLLAAMDSLAADNDPRAGGVRNWVLAFVALQEGRAADAVEHLDRGYVWHARPWDGRLLLAEAHAALGHLNEAIAQYDTLTGTYLLNQRDRTASFPLRPLAHERLGSLYLEVGDTVSAARHLSEFIELWKDADPELQPRVDQAEQALERVTGYY
ncbi:MAG: hypothetical protein JSV86_13570 [Gemmatimonadota bacterium]|nr:MAG: hypothetical protein JSV86_13570 [Gemmatimonadota bacterium]